jgi:hypothetical protein
MIFLLHHPPTALHFSLSFILYKSSSVRLPVPDWTFMSQHCTLVALFPPLSFSIAQSLVYVFTFVTRQRILRLIHGHIPDLTSMIALSLFFFIYGAGLALRLVLCGIGRRMSCIGGFGIWNGVEQNILAPLRGYDNGTHTLNGMTSFVLLFEVVNMLIEISYTSQVFLEWSFRGHQLYSQ